MLRLELLAELEAMAEQPAEVERLDPDLRAAAIERSYASCASMIDRVREVSRALGASDPRVLEAARR